jgi:hypothetical protein
MERFLLLAAVVGTTAAATGCQQRQPSAQVARPENLPEWRPDATLLAELAERTPIPGNPGCTIQPPKLYRQQPLEVDPGEPASGARWASPARPNGQENRLLVIIGKRGAGEAPTPPDQFARNFLASREAMVGQMQIQPVEHGIINGLPFARARWSAEHPVKKVRTHGFVYFASPGQLDIMLDSQDQEPHDAETLRLAEAAALTFRLAGAGR